MPSPLAQDSRATLRHTKNKRANTTRRRQLHTMPRRLSSQVHRHGVPILRAQRGALAAARRLRRVRRRYGRVTRLDRVPRVSRRLRARAARSGAVHTAALARWRQSSATRVAICHYLLLFGYDLSNFWPSTSNVFAHLYFAKNVTIALSSTLFVTPPLYSL